jgi:hypothetical protein
MPDRDDDPIHPNFDGIAFRVTTDRKGILAMPTHADRAPPYSYLTIIQAEELAGALGDLVDAARGIDGQSYAADFFGEVLEELRSAISACEP